MSLPLIRLIFWGVILATISSSDAMNSSFEQGKVCLQSHPIPKPQDPTVVPGFGGIDLPQSQIKAHDLGRAAQQSAQSNEASKILADTFENRQKYVIDSQKDPLFVAANQALTNQQKVMDGSLTEIPSSEVLSEEIRTCEESGDEYIQNCSKHLEIVLKITPEIRTPYRYCPPPGHPREKFQRHGFNSGYITVYEQCGGCATGEHVTPKKVEVIKEEWADGCAVLEAHVEKGVCRYVSASRSPQNETRMIQGEPQTRDHFEEHYQYACFKASSKSCAGLRDKGCYQTHSVCKEKIGIQCVLWEQTYRCPTGKKSLKSYRSADKESPFCLTGDCADTSYEANQDLFQVMSQMSVLKEAHDDLRKFATIFRGRDRRCTRNCLNFRDCCGSNKGWGVKINLTSCDADENELRELRDRNRCVMVGTYCAEKLGGQCIRKKTTFCCYDSKLAKIIQEQGRGQLGLGFGSPKNPQCQGLNPEQLSRIDFSKVNFSDLLQDVAAITKIPDPQAITQDIQRSMKDKTSHISNPQKVQGRGHGDF